MVFKIERDDFAITTSGLPVTPHTLALLSDALSSERGSTPGLA